MKIIPQGKLIFFTKNSINDSDWVIWIGWKTLIFIILVSGLFLFLTNTAEAACKRAYVCDDGCGYRDVCTSTFDMPSMDLDPMPKRSMRIKPLPSMKLPPLGTSSCRYKEVNGFWRNVCR